MAVDTDEQAIDAIKKFLSYLPSHNMAAAAGAPYRKVPTRPAKTSSISCRSRAQSVRRAQDCCRRCDKDSCFELKERFGKSITTMLARVDGKSTGFIANNPMFKGGALDADAVQKVISFMVLCDSFTSRWCSWSMCRAS